MQMFTAPTKVTPKPPTPSYHFQFGLKQYEVEAIKRDVLLIQGDTSRPSISAVTFDILEKMVEDIIFD